MARKLAATLAICMLVTLLAGCGGGKGDIVIGHYVPLSGDIAAWGEMEIKGVQLATEEINAAGGVLGQKIKVLSYDDRGDKVEAVNVVKKLISEKAVILLGNQSSSITMAAAPICAAAKVPVLATTSTNPKVTMGSDGKVNPWVFRACFIDPFQGEALAVYVARKVGKTKTATLYDIGDDFSVGLAEAFEHSYTKLGGQIVAKESFKGGEEDFRAQLTRIKQSNPEVLFLPTYYKEGALAMKQARVLGMDCAFVGGDGLDSTALVDLAGTACEGCAYSSQYSAEDTSPKVQTFVKNFQAKFKDMPDMNAAIGYDCVYMAIDAIKRAGKAEPQAIRDAMEATKDLECVTGIITFEKETHNPLDKPIIINTVKNGNMQFLERLDISKYK